MKIVAIGNRKKIKTIGQLYNNNVIVTYENMCKQYNLQSKQFYRYLQLRHLLREQFERKALKISRYPLIGILKSHGPKGLTSKLYSHLLQSKINGEPVGVREKWQGVIPGMSEQDWDEICSSNLRVSPAINNRIIQLNIIHQTYLAPNRLYKMGRMQASDCTRCGEGGTDFIHVMWQCGCIGRYWQQVVKKLGKVINKPMTATVELCVLGVVKDRVCGYTKIFLQKVLFLARKQIVEKWIQPSPPTINQWVRVVNQIVPCEKIMYEQRGNIQKYDKIWEKLNKSHLTTDIGRPEITV